MYSTLDGAKKCAKVLKSLLWQSGLSYSLAKCQGAVAIAGGYADWFTLSRALNCGPRDIIPFRYWQRLLDTLPEPCRPPVLRHLGTSASSENEPFDYWANDTLPYLVAIGMVHAGATRLVRPGSGEGQQMRLRMLNGWLLNGEGSSGLRPHLEPDSLRVVIDGTPQSTLPSIAGHAQFAAALVALTDAGIVEIGFKEIFIAPPTESGAAEEIIRRAVASQTPYEEPIEIIEMDPQTSALFLHQSRLDYEDSGPKVPYDQMDYRGVRLSSRYSVAHEFKAMQSVVDAMPDHVRLRTESIWCDSKACSVYSVEIILGMQAPHLADEIHEIFKASLDGFNGLLVDSGPDHKFFDPYWPGDEEYYASLEG